MKRIVPCVFYLFVLICALIATDRRAWAYVDPGSGLFALQGFASITAAMSYFFRRRILAFFGRSKKKTSDQHKRT